MLWMEILGFFSLSLRSVSHVLWAVVEAPEFGIQILSVASATLRNSTTVLCVRYVLRVRLGSSTIVSLWGYKVSNTKISSLSPFIFVLDFDQLFSSCKSRMTLSNFLSGQLERAAASGTSLYLSSSLSLSHVVAEELFCVGDPPPLAH